MGGNWNGKSLIQTHIGLEGVRITEMYRDCHCNASLCNSNCMCYDTIGVWLTCCCHQCVIYSLTTGSKTEVLDTVYVANARHMQYPAAYFDSYFYLPWEASLANWSYSVSSAIIQPVEQALKHSVSAIWIAFSWWKWLEMVGLALPNLLRQQTCSDNWSLDKWLLTVLKNYSH